jgi:putative N6-adenine methyltransferase
VYERHENEQYFFDAPTLAHLAGFVAAFDNPCCLCTPLLGRDLEIRGVSVRTLDKDERFSGLHGFRKYDLYRPEWLGEEFGLIICDPPFFGLSLSQLFAAVRTLSRNDFRQPLLICYLTRRAESLLGTFAPFHLERTGYCPGYQTVRKLERNEVEFFGNLGPEMHARLATAQTPTR